MTTGIRVNTIIDKLTVDSITDSILRILESGNDELTIQVALKVFESVCPKPITNIQGCKVIMHGEADGTE